MSKSDLNRAIAYGSERIPQHERFSGFWYDPERHAEVAMHLGVDLIRHEQRYYINEVNLDAALRPERRALYDTDIDPVFDEICRASKVQNFARVVLCTGRWADSYRREAELAAETHGITVELASTRLWRDRHSVPLPGLPVPLARDTRYVIFAGRHTAMDYLVHHKLGSASWLSNLAAGIPTSRSPQPGPFEPESPWPNLVAKLAGRDRGQFVLFAKVENEQRAREVLGIASDRAVPKAFNQSLFERLETRWLGLGPAIYQPYIAPELTEDNKICTYRLHLLVAPLETRFLSAHSITSGVRVPSRLTPGIVSDSEPYVTSFARGARYARVAEADEIRLGEAAEEIGTALREVLARRFVIEA